MTLSPTRPGERTAPRRATPSWTMIVAGYVCIVAGGLLAAVTGPLGLAHGSWAAAYLVLVGGVGQLALGWVPGVLARPTAGRSAWAVVITWNTGNLLVLGGTIAGVTLGVDAGSVLLAGALLLALVALSGWRGGLPPDRSRWVLVLGWAYLGLLLLLVVSIPVGLVLAHLR